MGLIKDVGTGEIIHVRQNFETVEPHEILIEQLTLLFKKSREDIPCTELAALSDAMVNLYKTLQD